MARDINKRLDSLSKRRKGTDRILDVSMDSAAEVLAKSFLVEAYAKRAPQKSNTQYALGAMQAVDPDYTRISLEEADRVAAQLRTGLAKTTIDVDFRLQGSVACDVHIRGVSDVDLLVIEERYFRYSTEGQKAKLGYYNNPVSYNTLSALTELRTESEKILIDAFPKATVTTTGSKAIKLTGGSLRRPVDVVPANWFNTPDYQLTANESDRGIEILDMSTSTRILNLPFRHISHINQRDSQSLGGLKKSIRLCKSVKADALDEGTKIDLSSFDIAATMWHANIPALTVGIADELSILAEATRYLDFLVRNNDHAKTLQVPDGSRKIFDSNNKLEALLQLSLEMDDLAEKVLREQNALTDTPFTQQQIFEHLQRTHIPG